MNDLLSKNKAKYFTLNFSDISSSGVKKITQSFNSNNAKVIEVIASNQQKKSKQKGTEKDALFVFENGQTITLTFNDTGSVFRVKLNSSIIPVTNLNTVSGMVKELVKAMATNQSKFDKALARKAAAAVKDVSKVRAAKKTVNQQITEAKAALSAANINIENNQKYLGELSVAVTGSNQELDTLKNKLSALSSEENNLIEQLETLRG